MEIFPLDFWLSPGGNYTLSLVEFFHSIFWWGSKRVNNILQSSNTDFCSFSKSVVCSLKICSFQASLGKTHIRAKDSNFLVNCLLFRERKLVGTPLLMQMLLSAAAFHCGWPSFSLSVTAAHLHLTHGIIVRQQIYIDQKDFISLFYYSKAERWGRRNPSNLVRENFVVHTLRGDSFLFFIPLDLLLCPICQVFSQTYSLCSNANAK